jgi:hypothetical protein
VLHTESLCEVVACPRGYHRNAAVRTAAENCLGYSGARSVTSDRDDDTNSGVERVLGETLFVTGGSCRYYSSDISALKSCCDLRDSRGDVSASRRGVDDYFD